MNQLAGNPITDLPDIQPWEFDNADNPFNDLFSQLYIPNNTTKYRYRRQSERGY